MTEQVILGDKGMGVYCEITCGPCAISARAVHGDMVSYCTGTREDMCLLRTMLDKALETPPEPRTIELEIDSGRMLQELGIKPVEVPRLDMDILSYAVKCNKGMVKTSTVKNHVLEQCGHRMMSAQDIRNHLDFMVSSGYLERPVRSGQVYVWKVSEKGRSVVQ